MSSPRSLEKRILLRFLENIKKDESLPSSVRESLAKTVDLEGFPDIAALESAIEQAMGHAHD